MSSNPNSYDTVIVTKDGMVSIDLRDTVNRLSQLIEDNHGCKDINLQNCTKDQLQHFMQQLYKTDDRDLSDKNELDETTLIADSQKNFMEISDDNTNRPTLSLNVPTFGPGSFWMLLYF